MGKVMAAKVQGEIQQWQRISLDFTGPQLSEAAKTFTDYRLNVTFRHSSGQTMVVPGYFAADGNAGDSGASSGSVWRVNFNPMLAGNWTYEASFRTGAGVAIKLDAGAGAATSFNGTTGTLNVAAASTDPNDGAFRTEGMVVQSGHYLVHKGSGDVFIKAGANSPENFLAYDGFDNTYRNSTGKLHSFDPHLKDWDSGNPTWANGRGKEIIGTINYLAEKGLNDQYFLTMNVGGDSKDVWPWISDQPGSRLIYDVSKLDQWEEVFQHMDDKGVLMHVVTQETENDQLLGGLTQERMVYYRELVARFGHHNGVIWNIGEESSNTTTEQKAFADYIRAVDPYDHMINIHNYPGEEQKVFGPLVSQTSYDGVSLQKTGNVRTEVAKWLKASGDAGNPWIVTWDETGPPGTGIMRDAATGADANHDKLRANMWGALTAGAAGIEWYAGGEDQSLEDMRNRDDVWTWTAAAKNFFQTYLPVKEMRQADALTTGTSGEDFVIAKPGSVYAIYLPAGGSATLDLRGQSGSYDVSWFDPRHGGALQHGGVANVSGGGLVSLGNAPNSTLEDWTILVRKTGSAPPAAAPSQPAGAGTGTAGNDTLTGGTGADKLTGLAGNDTLNGMDGIDTLDGGDGNDMLDGGKAADRMAGGRGNDTYIVDSSGDQVIELAAGGTDTIKSTVTFTLSADVEDLKLIGSAAINATGNALGNRITGNAANNLLNGGAGNDILDGSAGADSLTGGAGNDLFDFNLLSDSRGTATDRVVDFVKGQDRFDFSTLDANSALSGNQAFTFIGKTLFTGKAGELRYDSTSTATNVFLDVDGNKTADFQVRIDGSHSLAAADFVL
jgi:Ca2+-binding RTX toxin-like protein